AALGKVHDVLFLVAGPGNIFLSFSQWRTYAVNTGHHPAEIFVNQLEYIDADSRHDAHAHDDIRRIGQLYADLRHRRSDRPHTEGEHVHGASAHCAVEHLLQLAAHDVRVFPVVRRAGVVLRQGTNESTVLDPGDITRIGAGQKTSWPQFLVQLGEG